MWTQPTALKGCPSLRSSAGPVLWKHSSPGPQDKVGEQPSHLTGVSQSRCMHWGWGERLLWLLTFTGKETGDPAIPTPRM